MSTSDSLQINIFPIFVQLLAVSPSNARWSWLISVDYKLGIEGKCLLRMNVFVSLLLSMSGKSVFLIAGSAFQSKCLLERSQINSNDKAVMNRFVALLSLFYESPITGCLTSSIWNESHTTIWHIAHSTPNSEFSTKLLTHISRLDDPEFLHHQL